MNNTSRASGDLEDEDVIIFQKPSWGIVHWDEGRIKTAK
jgi:hypothetical protein